MKRDGARVFVDAIAFAADRHRRQRRKDAEASPYINHPIALARVLTVEAGLSDPLLLAAAVLHDTLEDTETSYEELAERFGPVVASVVAEVSDDKTLAKKVRKRLQIEHAAKISRRAKLVKLADKICNVRDVASSPPRGWPLRRRREYFDWARAVVRRMRGTNRKLERLFEQAYARRP